MFRSIVFIMSILISLVSYPAYSEESKQDGEKSTTGDLRQLVTMPEQARQFMREDMLVHLSALNEINGHLADNNLQAAANVAETRMGQSAMGKHRASGMGPGRFMPLEMRKIGWGMHEAASEFAVIAKKGGAKNTYKALQKVTSLCVACHMSYRTR